jgi:hypothetical protein
MIVTNVKKTVPSQPEWLVHLKVKTYCAHGIELTVNSFEFGVLSSVSQKYFFTFWNNTH